MPGKVLGARETAMNQIESSYSWEETDYNQNKEVKYILCHKVIRVIQRKINWGRGFSMYTCKGVTSIFF